MPSRTEKNEERRSQILNAAMKIFARDGFQKARMDDIAKETGVAKGTVYLYFKSKEEIIKSTIDRLFLGEFKEIMALIDQEMSAKDKLNQVFEIVINDYKNLTPFLPILYEFYAYAIRKKGLRKIFSEYFDRYMELLSTIIQQGIDQEEFKPCDPREAAVAIGALIEGMLLLSIFVPDEIDIEKHTRFGVQTVLAGLLIEKP